jgi:hypothetical protein
MSELFDMSYLNDAAEQIDAAMFSGDDFTFRQNRDALCYYILRWQREMVRLEQETSNEH